MVKRSTRQKGASELSSILKKRRKTISLAESCTGGLASSLITDIAGCSKFYLGSVVSYSNKVKQDQLFVPAEMIRKYGAVSPQVAGAMAVGISKITGSDVSASITGIAGPGGGTSTKPVGTAYVAYYDREKKRTKKIICSGTRVQVKEKFARSLLNFIVKNLKT